MDESRDTQLLPLLCPLRFNSRCVLLSSLSQLISLSFDHTQDGTSNCLLACLRACMLIEGRSLVLLFVHLLMPNPFTKLTHTHTHTHRHREIKQQNKSTNNKSIKNFTVNQFVRAAPRTTKNKQSVAQVRGKRDKEWENIYISRDKTSSMNGISDLTTRLLEN